MLTAVTRIEKSDCGISGSPKEAEIEKTDEAPPFIINRVLTAVSIRFFEEAFGPDVQAIILTFVSEDSPCIACDEVPT